MVSFSGPSLDHFKAFFTLEIYKVFQDRLTFLNRHMVVWFGWIFSICEIYGEYRTAGH